MKRTAKFRKPTPSEKREFIPECKDCQRERREQKAKSHKLTPSEIYSLLSAPLPSEALTRIGNSNLTAINDAYVRERLNQVLGPDGWFMYQPLFTSCEISKDADGAILRDSNNEPYITATASVVINIKTLKKTYYGEGGHQSTDRGNARKGAVTDAFGNALKDLVGIEVYKNQVNAYDLLTPEAIKSYRLGFECGWVYGKDGLTLNEAFAKDDWLKIPLTKSAETS